MRASVDDLTIRPATAADVPALARNAMEGIAGYAAFLPPGWRPPDAVREHARVEERIAAPATWSRVALHDGTLVGQVLFEPARDLEAVAHLAGLFVAEPWWGSGLATRLHGLAIDAMRAAGFARARLFTPELQARARAFYEREGWRAEGEPFFEPPLDMSLVMYMREL